MVGGTACHNTAVAARDAGDPMGNEESQHCLRTEPDQSHTHGACPCHTFLGGKVSGLYKSTAIDTFGPKVLPRKGARTARTNTTVTSMKTRPA